MASENIHQKIPLREFLTAVVYLAYIHGLSANSCRAIISYQDIHGFSSLPEELVENIVSRLSLADLKNLAQANSELKNIVYPLIQRRLTNTPGLSFWMIARGEPAGVISECLVADSANGFDIDRKFRFESLLSLASEHGHYPAAQELVRCGANINDSLYGSFTPIENAVRTGNAKLAELLLEKKAVLGRSLYIAVLHNHFFIVLLLLINGADVNQEFYSTGENVLSNAASDGHYELVKLLVENGADVNKIYKERTTALGQAYSHGHIDIAEYLIEQGAHIMGVFMNAGVYYSRSDAIYPKARQFMSNVLEKIILPEMEHYFVLNSLKNVLKKEETTAEDLIELNKFEVFKNEESVLGKIYKSCEPFLRVKSVVPINNARNSWLAATFAPIFLSAPVSGMGYMGRPK